MKESIYLFKAITKLKPESEYVLIDDDYSTIQWVVLEGKAPTQAEIDNAIKEIKAEEIAKTKANALLKSALLAKLGITEDEAKLLLS